MLVTDEGDAYIAPIKYIFLSILFIFQLSTVYYIFTRRDTCLFAERIIIPVNLATEI